MTNRWKMIAILAALAGGVAQAAPRADAFVRHCSAESSIENDKLAFGYAERSASSSRDLYPESGESRSEDLWLTDADSGQSEYDAGTEPSFPGIH